MLITILGLKSTVVNSQVAFINNLSWEEVKEKAKQENKYILVDCYATWCVPCKRMENEVFTDTVLGKFINKHFIAVKVQMDKTTSDKQEVKNWYPEAVLLQKNYAVDVFPTYLYFSSSGVVVHKSVGYEPTSLFMQQAKNAMDPEKQLYTILKKYNIHDLDSAKLKSLALEYIETDVQLAEPFAVEYLSRLAVSELGRQDVVSLMTTFAASQRIASYAVQYIARLPVQQYSVPSNLNLIAIFSSNAEVQRLVTKNLQNLNDDQISKSSGLFSLFTSDSMIKKKVVSYYNHLSTKKRLQRKNLLLFYSFSSSTKDPWFKLFYENKFAIKVDSIIRSVPVEGLYRPRAKDKANSMFSSEYLADDFTKARKGQMVDWQQVSSELQKRFRKDFVDENILNAQIGVCYYLQLKDEKYRQEYFRLRLLQGERYGWDTTAAFIEAVYINGFLWDVFLYSKDKTQLLTGVKWMEGIIRRNPKTSYLIDTYANLLYKAGKKDEAIAMERKALEIARAIKDQSMNQEGLQKNLDKMLKGEPTWLNVN